MNRTFANQLRRAMRQQHVTIESLASAMSVTIERVREVRATGRAPAHVTTNAWQQDWFDGIRAARAQS